MKKSRSHFIVILQRIALPALAASLLQAANAYAEATQSPLSSVAPIGAIFPSPLGILYPDFNAAAGIDAAALTSDRATAVQASFTPAASALDSTNFLGSVATSASKFGMGLGYTGALLNNQLTNGVFAGMAYKFDPVSVGVGVRNANLNGGTTDIDLSVLYGGQYGLAIGGVLYHVNSSPQVDFGVGFKSGKRYHLEANVLLPAFSNLGGGYTFTVAGGINVGIFGIAFNSSYFTQFSNFQHYMDLIFWLGGSFNVIIQYSTPRYFTGGITYVF